MHKKMDPAKPSRTYGVVESKSQAKRIAIQMKPLMEAWAAYVAQSHAPKREFDSAKTARAWTRDELHLQIQVEEGQQDRPKAA